MLWVLGTFGSLGLFVCKNSKPQEPASNGYHGRDRGKLYIDPIMIPVWTEGTLSCLFLTSKEIF